MQTSAEIRAHKPKKPSKWLYKKYYLGLLFVAPAIIFNLVFDWYPMLDGVFKSFFNWNGYNSPTFVGFDNFIEIFQDRIFGASLLNLLFFLTANLILMFSTIFASVILFRIKNMRAQYLYRVLLCIPMVVPGMVIMLMWQFMYNPQYGLFNKIIEFLGHPELAQTWLGDSSLVKWCLIFMGFPFVATNATLIYLGGLKSISDSVWEAGTLDGVGPIKKFFTLEFPLILGQYKLNLIGVIAGSITGYGAQLIMTKGGPGFSSLVPGLYMYNSAFAGNRYGYASAIGLVLFGMSLLLTLLMMKFIKGTESD